MQSDWAVSVIETRDGGFVLIGTTKSSSVHPGLDRFWLVKVGVDGVVQWEQTYGNHGARSAHAGIQTGDGGFIIAGTTYMGEQRDWDICLMKTDANGVEDWTQIYGGAEWNEGASGIIQTADGNYVTTGGDG